MRSSNPVLTRLGEASRRERAASPDIDLGGYQVQQSYYQPLPLPDAMTLDDVVVRTVVLLMVTGIAGALSWLLLPTGPMVMAAMIGSSLAGFVLAMVISFGRITNPIPIVGYAVLEGILLGVVSRWFEAAYSGIVIQAVVGTFGVFAAMAALYKAKVLRATPKFTRFVLGALIGIVVLSLVNFAAAAFGHNLGLIDYSVTGKVGWMPIIFSLAAVAIGALTFILDFDAVEQGTRAGLPQRYSWYCAFGMLVGLIFLYWQLLRLLGYARR